jgi:hypothetical protein
VAAVIMGTASLVWPALPGALGQTGGAAATLWGILFVAVAERERRAGVSAARGKETSP